MSSISKACMELSKSIKSFRFGRVNSSSPSATKTGDDVDGFGVSFFKTSLINKDGSSVTDNVIPISESVSNTITRAIRSATNKVRSFPLDRSNATSASLTDKNGHKSTVVVSTKVVYNVWLDKEFLVRFFEYFSVSDMGVLARVCKQWRDVIYQPKYWKDVTAIIHCRELQKDDENRYKFYRSVEIREFESICFVGIVDGDVDGVLQSLEYAKTHVTSLTIKNSNIEDKGMEILLGNLTNVCTLQVTGCNEVTEAGLWTCLSPRVTAFSISDCINVADDTIAAIAQMLPSLHELNLQAYHVTDSALSLFSAKQSYTLRILRLNSCWEITNHGVLNAVHSLPNLNTLSLSGCSKITDDGIEVIAENLRQLKSLDLSWCSRITDAALEYIACDLGQLEQLTLDRCCHITDIGVGYLSTMTSLSYLFLRWCIQLRDFGLQHLYTMKNLKILSLAGCNQLTSNGLSGLVQIKSLQELELTNCCGLTTDVALLLKENMTECLIVE